MMRAWRQASLTTRPSASDAAAIRSSLPDLWGSNSGGQVHSPTPQVSSCGGPPPPPQLHANYLVLHPPGPASNWSQASDNPEMMPSFRTPATRRNPRGPSIYTPYSRGVSCPIIYGIPLDAVYGRTTGRVTTASVALTKLNNS